MNILLDTHSFLWFSENNPKLSKSAKALIENIENTCMISVASLWEMAIKVSLGKLKIKAGYSNLINQIIKYDFIILPITFEHTEKIASMSFHHRDPFDRILIAQSQVEELTLVSSDTILDKYNIKRVW